MFVLFFFFNFVFWRYAEFFLRNNKNKLFSRNGHPLANSRQIDGSKNDNNVNDTRIPEPDGISLRGCALSRSQFATERQNGMHLQMHLPFISPKHKCMCSYDGWCGNASGIAHFQAISAVFLCYIHGLDHRVHLTEMSEIMLDRAHCSIYIIEYAHREWER